MALPLPAPLSMDPSSMAALPPYFQPARASSPLLADATDSDEAGTDFDEAGTDSESDDELPAAEPDSSYHESFDQSFVR